MQAKKPKEEYIIISYNRYVNNLKCNIIFDNLRLFLLNKLDTQLELYKIHIQLNHLHLMEHIFLHFISYTKYIEPERRKKHMLYLKISLLLLLPKFRYLF